MKTNEIATKLRALIRDILSEFILHPDALNISTIPLSESVSLRIEAHSGDVGRIIGEKGAHFNSLRVICRLAGLKNAIDIELQPVAEPASGRSDRYNRFEGRDDWAKDKVVALLRRAVAMLMRCEDAIEIEVEDLSDFVSTISVFVSRDESLKTVDMVQAAMKVLFNAVGKANGRTLLLEVVACKAVDPPQPKEASGRNAREIRR